MIATISRFAVSFDLYSRDSCIDFAPRKPILRRHLLEPSGRRGENPILDKDIQISLEQLRNIEKKVAFDPTVLIDLEDHGAMCA
jgi:hypothetical protein